VTAFDQESDIWVLDLARAALTRVTSDPGTHAFPVWMQDGRRVVFGSNRAGAFNLFSQAADGSGRAERLIESPNSQTPTAISPDGMLLVFTEYSAKTAGDVMALRLDGTHDVRALVQSSFDERNGIMSPDGRWLAYEADDSGAFEIYVRPFPDVARERWRVSTGGGTRPLWGRDGKELFYHAFDGALMRVSLAGGPAWTAGVPMKVLEGRYAVGSSSNIFRNYDIVADGQRFLMLKTAGSNATEVMPQIVVIEHFDEELKRLVPAK
jgi:Tol biopolymer transport system component